MTAWTAEPGSATPEESEIVSTLLAMIGGTEDQADSVLSVYRLNGRNADKAAEVLLTEGSGWMQDTGSSSTSKALVPIIKTPSARHNTPDIPNLIDLTRDDDRMAVDDDEDLEMKRALELSMEGIQEGFSVYAEERERSGTRDKEMVMENDDEQVEDFEQLIRKDGRPISLLSPTPETSYAVLLLQALFHVPQVRNRLANVPISSLPVDSDLSLIIELFGNLDLAKLARLDCDGVCKALNIWPLTATATISDATKDLYEVLAGIFEAAVASQTDTPLLTFTSAQVSIDPSQREKPQVGLMSNHTYVALDPSPPSSGPPGEPLGNDLVTRLARDLSKPVLDIPGGPSGSTDTVISTPSDVVAFVLTSPDPSLVSSTSPPVSFAVPLHNASSSSTPPSSRFSYPSSLYIDPFLLSNFPLVHSKRMDRERLAKELRDHEEVRRKLIGKEYASTSSTSTSASAPTSESLNYNFQDQGVLPSIRSTLYYYEHVANRSEGEDGTEMGAMERKRTVEEVEKSLRATLEGIEETLKDLDAKISAAKAQMTPLFEEEELKKHQYDLRAVLMQPMPSATSHPTVSELHSLSQVPNTSTSKQKRSQASKLERGRDEPFVYIRDIRDDLIMTNVGPDELSKNKARWWKSPASTSARAYVEEVPEEVVLSLASSLSPSTESVPYMLIYSKSLSSSTSIDSSSTSTSVPSNSSSQWPSSIVTSVELNNNRFMEMAELWRASKEQKGHTGREPGKQGDQLKRDISMIDLTR
ncbi:hypothetical protein DFJ43DRAFT_1097473 [Lentinula guzmanii]|uniref:CUE domain-containing protein n=1 Tax=Lentinula guzmanii TaxID=2804957 RepID=A0AA38MX76_9AGAR|nr:hypothetical protein DFJ43DRAFT_1097473 [Lentinula guzmanii]